MTGMEFDPVADLHVHTTASDGTLAIQGLSTAARRAGLEAIAVTDHDLVHPDLDAPAQRLDGIWVIRGIELKVERESGERLDILGYAINDTNELSDLLDRLQSNRIERATAMIDRLESRLEITLPVEVGHGIGRPHLARAVAAHPETDYSIDEVFADLIGDGRPCHVARWVPSYEEGVRALRRACPVVAVAHPLRYAHVETALAVARDLGAIERWYPYDRSVDCRRLEAFIADHDLLPTGGSDAHGRELGTAGPDRAALDRLLDGCGIR